VRTPISAEDRALGEKLGTTLAELRRSSGLTSQALADSVGVSVDSVRSVEAGRIVAPSFLYVAKVARSLGESLDGIDERLWVDAE
jgi:transcriptional regulator with XRE-family HTH domain